MTHQEHSLPAPQHLTVHCAKDTGPFRGGATGTLYGLGDQGSPTDTILRGALIENTSQKPPFGKQHPSGDALAIERQYFATGGSELGIYIQDYYPEWPYDSYNRPGDTVTYTLDVLPDDPRYGTASDGANGRWDYAEITELVMNSLLSNTQYPDKYLFIPFNEADMDNWYKSEDDEQAPIFEQFLNDWDDIYELIQRIWNDYRNGTASCKVRPTLDHARVAGPGDHKWRPKRTRRFLEHTAAHGTLPDVFVWHELGKESLRDYRSRYRDYRTIERECGIDPLPVNITEYGEMRDMSVPGQLIQWQAMFEDTKVQAETAFWGYSGNISDNMARANNANGGWWQFKWYGDLRGSRTVEVHSDTPSAADSLQGIAAVDDSGPKLTVLFGGANDSNEDQVRNVGANIPVTVHIDGLDERGFGSFADVEVRQNAYVGPDGVSDVPNVVFSQQAIAIEHGTVSITVPSADRYASYQLILTPHGDVHEPVDDGKHGRWQTAFEAEDMEVHGATIVSISPWTKEWGDFMVSGNRMVSEFGAHSEAIWPIDVPRDGMYRLQLIGGNPGFPTSLPVDVDNEYRATLHFGAQCSTMPSSVMLHRESAEAVIGLTQGRHLIRFGGSDRTMSLDKALLTFVGRNDGALDHVAYPANQFRLSKGACLDFSRTGARGFVNLNQGEATVFVQAWQAGHHDITVELQAPSETSVALRINRQDVGTLTGEDDRLVAHTIRAALAEGINAIDCMAIGNGAMIRRITVSRPRTCETPLRFTADDVRLEGGAHIVASPICNASEHRYIAGLGNQFVTDESGLEGTGDRRRVVILDKNNTPKVIERNKGVATIASGSVPAGRYLVDVSFSNGAIIAEHNYDPEIIDTGLQIRQHGKEVARSAFRFTFTAENFMHGYLYVTTDGSELSFGNWDRCGDRLAVVSQGVAPNIDALTFFPVVGA